MARTRGTGPFLLLTVLATAAWGRLHTELKVSEPGADSVLEAAPAAITLTYTTRVQLALSSVNVRSAGGGGEAVAAGELGYLADDRHDVLVLALREALGTGTYTVAWATAGPDGHRIAGEFEFRVDRSPVRTPEGAAAGAAVPVAGPPTPPGDEGTAGGSRAVGGDSGPTLVSGRMFERLALYVGIVAVLGAVVFRLLVLDRCARAGESREVIDSASHRVALLATLGFGFLVVLVPYRLWTQTRAFFPDEVAANLFTVATGTPWAVGWWVLVVSVLVIGRGLLVPGREGVRPSGWKSIAMGALLLPVVPLLSGHGWADSPRALSAAATYCHVAAAGGWMGGLACLLFAGLPALHNHRGGAPADTPGIAGMVGAFSRVARFAVALLLVTGTAKVWIHIGAVSDLWTTAWGRSLLVKDGVVAAVLVLGFYNWRFVRPALAESPRPGLIRGPALVELVLGIAAVSVTSYLVAQPLG